MRRMILILIVLFACLLWLHSPGTIVPRSGQGERQGGTKESFVSLVLTSSRIALSWGVPAALIYQLHALHAARGVEGPRGSLSKPAAPHGRDR